MIEEARRLPPSMLAVGIAFISLFVVLALGTIVAVMADDTPQVPALEGLPVIDESEIVDSISTCTDAACDGFGVLLMGRDLEAPVLTGRLTRLWRSKGWRSVPCVDEGGVCFADKDLRIRFLQTERMLVHRNCENLFRLLNRVDVGVVPISTISELFKRGILVITHAKAQYRKEHS